MPSASVRLKISTLIAALALYQAPAMAADDKPTGPERVGWAAQGDWRNDAPGVRRRLDAADLPVPDFAKAFANSPDVVAPPANATLRAPLGFNISLLATGLRVPRIVRTAPNGDLFVAESYANRIHVLRLSADGTKPVSDSIFAAGLNQPFGIAFYPPGPNPRYVYVANTDSVVRFPYRSGDLRASGRPEMVTHELPGGGHLRGGGHWTRDIVFSPDGATLYVSVGSRTNVAEGMGPRPADMGEDAGVLGAAWGDETHRANVLTFRPDGSNEHIFATGLRNCVGLAINPANGEPWCSTNERDELGDDVPPDYVTHVQAGGFYGWPWYYIGNHEEPRLAGQRPDLAVKAIVPDVLLQAHAASLGMVFYEGGQFPAPYKGDAFVAQHGSWNRLHRTGPKVIRILMKDGKPTGEYEDFLTGFAASDSGVWGRPVGVTVAKDGALIVTDDAGGKIWRVAYTGAR